MKAEKDLNSQQVHLAATDYDLRITNLARFIYSRLQTLDVGHRMIKLLDVGAGNGLILKFFKNHGFDVTGVEIEHELVAKMKKDPKLKGVSISQGDITKLIGKEQYAIVIASDVIEHIENDEKAIRNLWTFVKPGGLLIITVPAHSHLYGMRDVAWGHYRRYDKQVLVTHIREALKISNSKFQITKGISNANKYKVEYIGFWNIIGYFVYFFYEKILHKQINEEMRYGNSLKSKVVRTVLEFIFRVEEIVGGVPLGLTLLAFVKKTKYVS